MYRQNYNRLDLPVDLSTAADFDEVQNLQLVADSSTLLVSAAAGIPAANVLAAYCNLRLESSHKNCLVHPLNISTKQL